MIGVVDAHAAQRQAAAPGVSAWVSASAGTGKTKVLTDRLLGLMLEGSDPARVLCLTFTRAAAAEMANRLNERLAGWMTLPHAGFAEELRELTGRDPDDAMIPRAVSKSPRSMPSAKRCFNAFRWRRMFRPSSRCSTNAAPPKRCKRLPRASSSLRGVLRTGGNSQGRSQWSPVMSPRSASVC